MEANPEYVAARRVLLDALEAMGRQRRSVILVGAQAVYQHAIGYGRRTRSICTGSCVPSPVPSSQLASTGIELIRMPQRFRQKRSLRFAIMASVRMMSYPASGRCCWWRSDNGSQLCRARWRAHRSATAEPCEVAPTRRSRRCGPVGSRRQGRKLGLSGWRVVARRERAGHNLSQEGSRSPKKAPGSAPERLP